MDTDRNQSYYPSKRERLFGITIFILLLLSLLVDFCGFIDLFSKNIDYENNPKQMKQNISSNESIKLNNKDLFDIYITSFCLIAHLIWTIVPIIILDECCVSNNNSIYRILLKLFVCTRPLLFCSELNLVFIYHINSVQTDLLIISIKWLIFLATILISFWTGIISEKDKWRGVHGGQIAPKQQFPFNGF